MRGRVGGRIGVQSPPSSYSASGIWSLADVYTALRDGYGYSYGEGSWPTNTLSIDWSADYLDCTQDGTGTFSPTVTTTYTSVAYSWEKSTDAGSTWSTVAGETDATLALSGQTTANDGDQYRITVNAGLVVVTSSPATVQFDTVTLSASTPSGYAYGGTTYIDFYPSIIGDTYGRSYNATGYQWQASTDSGATWTNIAGATGQSFYTSTVTGTTYRVVVMFHSQTATSGAATVYDYG